MLLIIINNLERSYKRTKNSLIKEMNKVKCVRQKKVMKDRNYLKNLNEYYILMIIFILKNNDSLY